MTRLVHGWGISDIVYVGNCPIYKRWMRMIADPCRVDERWKYFTMFRAWYLEQSPKPGYRLNKMILGDGKLYSPETCCLVPKWLYLLFNNHRPNRGPWPQGVSKVGWKYVATLSRKGKRVYLSGFITPQEASVAYLEARLAYAEDLLAEFPQPIRVAAAIRLRMRGLLEREEAL